MKGLWSNVLAFFNRDVGDDFREMWNALKEPYEGGTSQCYGAEEEATQSFTWDDSPSINPATGYPMCGSIDTGGNAYGCGSSDSIFSSSSFDDDD